MVVQPWHDALQACHSLIYVVDVLAILQNGVGMLNDTEALLKQTLKSLKPGRTRLAKALIDVPAAVLPRRWRPSKVSRIAFLATKSDLMHRDDVDVATALVKSIAHHYVRDFPGVMAGYFACSAVISTVQLENDLLISADAEKKIATTRLPINGWPDTWSPGLYKWRRIPPYIPPRKAAPPKQDGLAEVFKFAMGWDRERRSR